MEKTYKILKVVLLVLCFVALLLGANRLYDMLGSQVQMDALVTQSTQPPQERETAQSNHITYWWNMRFYGGVEI